MVHDSQSKEFQLPRKRLFVGLLSLACAGFILIAFLLWWIPSAGLISFSPTLLRVFGSVVAGLSLLIISGLGLLVLTLLTGRDLFFSQRLRRLVIRYLFPGIIAFGRLLGVNCDTLQRSFIVLNNRLVRARELRVLPNEALILLPHCIQFFDCDFRITGTVERCKQCGRCDIGELSRLAKRYGVDIAVATGGTLARKIIVEKQPRFILAVACERDLTTGIRESYPLPVIGLLNTRPNGPCFNTTIRMEDVECLLNEHLIYPS
jgi:hypothetical protein